MERTRLTIDFGALLPGDEFQIGTQSVTIKPLSISQYKLVIGKISALVKMASMQGITLENFRESDKFIELAELVVDQFPVLLEEVSNIAAEDLQKLPIEIIVALIDKCLDVNLKAKESLLGNFKSLAAKFSQLGKVEEKSPSPKSSKN